MVRTQAQLWLNPPSPQNIIRVKCGSDPDYYGDPELNPDPDLKMTGICNANTLDANDKCNQTRRCIFTKKPGCMYKEG